MSQLPFADAITRYQGNEDRVDKFVNQYGTYTTSGGTPVKTLPSLADSFNTIAQAVGTGLLYGTYASANAAIAGIADQALVDIIVDETHSGLRTRYRKESGALVFKFTFDALRADLAASTGAAQVGSNAGTVQTDINARPTSATLASSGGAALIGAADGLTVQQDINARPSNALNLTLHNIPTDRVVLSDAVTNGTNVITSATYVHSPSNVGKLVVLYYANTANAPQTGTITASAANQITVSFTATASLTGLQLWYGSDALTGINSAIAAAAAANNSPQGSTQLDLQIPSVDILVSATPTNTYGVTFTGAGRILVVTSGTGLIQYNWQYDLNKVTTNKLAVAAIQKKFSTQTSNSTIISGDSQVAGQGIVDLNFRLDVNLSNYAQTRGFNPSFVTNAGHSGKAINDWYNGTTGYLTTDIPALGGGTPPDLYIIHGWTANSPRPDTNAPGNSVATQISLLRQGLAYIRANYDQSVVGVIVTMGSPCSNTPLFSDEKWNEKLVRGYAQACYDYQCCFLNTYALIRDALRGPGTSLLFDTNYAWNAHIHPLEMTNAAICDALYDIIYPKGLNTLSTSQFRNVPTTVRTPLSADLPNSYKIGQTWLAARVANGFPFDGAVLNHWVADGLGDLLQICAPNSSGSSQYLAYRVGNISSNTWFAWHKILGEPPRASITPAVVSSGGGTPTYTTQAGDTNLATTTCRFSIRISLSGLGTLAAGNVSITGLLAALGTSGVSATLPVFSCSISNITLSGGYTQVIALLSGTTLTLNKIGSGLARANLTVAELSATSEIFISGVYSTDPL